MLKEITIPTWFNWPVSGSVQKINYHRSDYPSDFSIPKGKMSIVEHKNAYNEPLLNGVPFALKYGATHVNRGQYPERYPIHTQKHHGGTAYDGWANDYVSVFDKDLEKVNNFNAFMKRYKEDCLDWYGGRYPGQMNYEVIILDGELFWNTSGSATLAAMYRLKNQLYPDMLIGAWAKSHTTASLMGVNRLNIDRYNETYKKGGVLTQYSAAGFEVMCNYAYHNNEVSNYYDRIYSSEIAKRLIKGTKKKELWSLWQFDEDIDHWKDMGIHMYKPLLKNGKRGFYRWRGTVPPALMYSSAIFAYFCLDGVQNWEAGYSSYDLEDLYTENAFLKNKTISYQNGPVNVAYQHYSGIHDWEYLARYQAHSQKDILEQDTDWQLIDFQIDGGKWYRNEQRYPSVAKLEKLPVVRVKYSTDGKEALLLVWNPSLCEAGFLSQVVDINDSRTGLKATVKLKSNWVSIARVSL